MAELHFDITADNTQFLDSVRQIQQGVRQAVDTISDVGKNFDVSTLDAQMVSLTKVIRDNEEAMQRASERIEKFGEDAKIALDSGDLATFKIIQDDIEAEAASLQKLSMETEQYRAALEMVQQVAGQQNEAVSTPMLFGTQEDYDRMVQMRQGIADLQSQIANFSGSEEELNALRSQLSEQVGELHAAELAAAKAAQAYGSDLGGRASEASQKLFALNNAVEQQRDTVESLREQAEQAAESLEQLKASSDTAEIEQAQIAYDNVAQSLQNAEMALVNMETAQSHAQSSWNSINSEMEQHNSIMVKMLGGQEKFTQIVSGLPGPLQAAINGLQGMTGAARAFIATPLGAVIAALVLAWQALTSWFNSSAEGQMAFAKISGYTSGILNQLKEIAIRVGKFLYKMFTDPKKAITEFYEAVKKNVINRLKAVGDIAKATGEIIYHAFTFKFDLIKEDLNNLMKSFLQFGTGVENVAGKVANAFKNMHEKASENASIEVEKKQLEMEVSEWQKESAKLDKQKAEAQRKMYDTSLSKAERKKAADEYKAVLQKQSDTEKKFADKRVELQKRSMELTTNSLEDYQQLNQLEAESVQIEARHEQQLASLQRRMNMINRAGGGGGAKGGKGDKTAADTAKFKKAIDTMVSLQESLESAVKDADAALTSNERERSLAEINRSYEKAVKSLQKTRERYQEQAKIAGISESDKDYKATMELIERRLEQLNQIRENSIKDTYANERQSMLNYLKEYGTFQQQKLAIAEEYAEKIANAQRKGDKGEELKLTRERDNRMAELNAKNIAMSIDWGVAFKGVGNVLGDIARETLKKVEDYMATAEFKGLDAANKKAYTDLRNKLIEEIGGGATSPFNFKIWGQIEQQVRSYQDAVKRTQTAQDAHNKAVEELTKAKENETKATTDAEKAVASYKTSLAQQAVDRTAQSLEGAQAEQSQAQTELTNSTTKAANGMDNFAKYLGEIKSGGLYGFANGITKLVTSLAGGTDSIGKSLGELGGKIGGLIGAILQILDMLGDAPAEFIGGLLDKIGDIIEKILSDLPKIIGNVVEGVVGIVKGIFAGIASWFTSGGTESKTARLTERLTESNDALRHSVDKLTEEIESKAGGEAVKAYLQARTNQSAYEENARQILEAQMRKYGKHQSNAYYLSREFDSSDWAKISMLLGRQVTSVTDLLQLTPDMIEKIRTELPGLWTRIVTAGKYDDVKQYWEEYADQAGMAEELTQKIHDNLTQTSFDNLLSSFEEALMDMDASAADWSDKFAETMQRSLLHYAIGDKFQKRIQEWYDGWAKTLQDQNGKMTDAQIESYRTQWDAFIREGMATRDEIARLTGYDGGSTEERGTYGAMKSFSQEQGDEMNGRLTAMLIGQESIRRDVTAGVEMLRSMAQMGNEMQGIMLSNNSHLEDIARYTRITSQFGEKLDRIIINTDKL